MKYYCAHFVIKIEKNLASREDFNTIDLMMLLDRGLLFGPLGVPVLPTLRSCAVLN